MAHYYRVELTRKVRAGDMGAFAYRSSTRRRDFPFGKAHDLKTGAQALEVARAYANEHLDEAGEVAIWRLTGAGNGTGTYLKSEPDQRFDADWPS